MLDLCDGTGNPERVVEWVTKAVQHRLTKPQRLREALARRSRFRYRALLLGLLEDVAEGAETFLELRYLNDVERAHGLPRGNRQHESRRGAGFRDVRYDRFAVELDGRLGHEGMGRSRDLRRDNLAVLDDEVTLRYGTPDVTGRCCVVAWQVGEVLMRRGWEGPLERSPHSARAERAEMIEHGRMADMRLDSTRRDLRSEIDACGYFPDLVEDSVLAAVAEEDLVDFVVHHEPTFNRDEIHRHVTVLALTPTRLVVGHTDDQPAEPPQTGTYAAASTESVPLNKINTVVVTRVVASPEAYAPGSEVADETWLSVGWGALRRVDIEQASCSDPQCEADHGYTGTLAGDDLTVRMSTAADGADRVARLVRFGGTLQRMSAV